MKKRLRAKISTHEGYGHIEVSLTLYIVHVHNTYTWFVFIILRHGLLKNQLMEILQGEADHVSPDHDHVSLDNVQPSYILDDSDAVKERRYRNAQEMLRVAMNAMCDIEFAFS